MQNITEDGVVVDAKIWKNRAKNAGERRKLGFVTLNGNLTVSGWVGLAYDR